MNQLYHLLECVRPAGEIGVAKEYAFICTWLCRWYTNEFVDDDTSLQSGAWAAVHLKLQVKKIQGFNYQMLN